MSDTSPVYAVVCAGGGAHGAYQVGVLNYVHEHFARGDASPFRLFAGTSAGSLNTTFYACRSYDARRAALELDRMWREFDVPKYHGNVVLNTIRATLKGMGAPRSRRRASWSLLDPGPLVEVVHRGYDREALDRSIAEGTTLGAAVSATEVRSSRCVYFLEGPRASAWNSGFNLSIVTRLCPEHVVASCSVPFAFPPVRIGEHWYSDGGVANKTPIAPAIHMGATRVLSVATDQPLPNELPRCPPDFRPRLPDVLRMLGDQLSFDYATGYASWVEIVNYFREQLPADERARFERVLDGRELRLGAYRPVEIELFAPSRRIRYTDMYDPEFLDADLEGTSTVLRFSREFVGRLIDLGYEDARGRHDELARFFDPDRPQRRSIYAEPEEEQTRERAHHEASAAERG